MSYNFILVPFHGVFVLRLEWLSTGGFVPHLYGVACAVHLKVCCGVVLIKHVRAVFCNHILLL